MFAGCLQIMWAHLQLIRVEGVGYSQLIRAEKADVCRSCDLCLQAATDSVIFIVLTLRVGTIKLDPNLPESSYLTKCNFCPNISGVTNTTPPSLT
jgi:hypothetical protein